MSYTVRAAILTDALTLADNLREEDLAEIKASVNRPALDVLLEGIRGGRTWVGVDAEGPYGIFGVAPSQDPQVGHPWMLATPRLLQHQRQFLRECAGAVRELHRDYPVLRNYVDARNTVHIRWLAWCGFEFLRLHPHAGVEQIPFFEFQRLSH